MTVSQTAVAAAVADAHRREWAFVLAATVHITRDLDLAEECVQEAYASALSAWAVSGVPHNPAAWLTTAARNRARDVLRRSATARRVLPLLVVDRSVHENPNEPDIIEDDRLRLIFTCCHPALHESAQVALTLRLVCGLTTQEIARAFLVSTATMAARITRAKKKIAEARIPYRVPSPAEFSERIDAVLNVVHLVFTTGHTAPAGDRLVRGDLIERSLELARMLRDLLPDDDAVAGLVALVLFGHARRDARVDPNGRLVLLPEQDRNAWDKREIDEGIVLVRRALRRRPPAKYALMAAIAAVHTEAPSRAAIDWQEVVGLYDLLHEMWPSPVVALNRAVAVGEAHGPQAGLTELDRLAVEPQLAGYHYLPAARAEMLRRLERLADARLAYQEAALLAENSIERDFILDKLDELQA